MRAAALRVRDVRLDAVATAPLATPLLLVALLAVSTVLRTRILDAGYWIDEGITVGIAHHPFTHIPHVLRHDGAPPLYYLLLHVWIKLFGDSEARTHTLSLLFALAAIPTAYWSAASLFGRRAAWICAGLASVNPFMTVYAQETRMYSIVMLLSFVATAAFVHAFVYARRRYAILLWATLVVLLYTHNWAFFLIAGVAAAAIACARELPEERRRIGIDGALVIVGAAIVYLPWLPFFLDQFHHTGAPWSSTPGFTTLVGAPAAVVSGNGALMALFLAGGTGLVAIWEGKNRREQLAIITIVVLIVTTIFTAWIASRISPAWANRYLAIVLGPLLILGAAGLARARRLGVVGLVFVLLYWSFNGASPNKSNVRDIATQLTARMSDGDWLLSTHAEQIPVIHYYLHRRITLANSMGVVPDPSFMNWTDAYKRMRDTHPRALLDRLAPRVPSGAHFVLVTPVFRDYRSWNAPWTYLVYRRSVQWASLLGHDRRFRYDGTVATDEISVGKKYFKAVQAAVYTKR